MSMQQAEVTQSAAFGQFVQFALGEPVKPVRIEARPVVTHYMFEDPSDIDDESDELL